MSCPILIRSETHLCVVPFLSGLAHICVLSFCCCCCLFVSVSVLLLLLLFGAGVRSEVYVLPYFCQVKANLCYPILLREVAQCHFRW